MSNVLGRGLDALLIEDSAKVERPRQNEATEISQSNEHSAKESGFGNGRSAQGDARSLNERPKESVFWVETEKIKPNPEQPRTHFDEEKIRALSESIRQYGMLQPIVVSKREIDVPTGTQVEYQIIAGERRYRAASMIGLQHIPAIIRREESDKIKLELALIENLQREDLNPMEKAYAYRRLMDEFHLIAKEVGMRVGKSREAVTNTVRLLLLPEYIQNAVSQGRVTEGQVRPLISLSHSFDEQHALFQRVVSEGLATRDVEAAARQVFARIGHIIRSPKKFDKDTFDATTRSFEVQLADVLGTRVSVRRSREGKGKISIEFFSESEFQNLMARMAAVQEQEQEQEQASSVNNTAENSVAIYPSPSSEPDEFSSPQEGVARPEDLTTFTV